MITLWLEAITPTRLPLRDERGDHPGAGVGLSRSGRTLNREHRVAKFADDGDGEVGAAGAVGLTECARREAG